MIEIKKLLKVFKTGDVELRALKELSFSIPSKQFLSISGKSGSGKSTLLYQISLLDLPTSGTVEFDGNDAISFSDSEKINFRRTNFGFIFQDYALLPTLTAKENVMLPLIMQGVNKEDSKKRAEESLSKVDLSDKFDNLPSQMSGGQQQRVSIARAIVHNPKYLFADEPTANLDEESSHLILDIFKGLNHEGLTIIMVTHESDYAKLADRNIVLSDGNIIKDSIIKKG